MEKTPIGLCHKAFAIQMPLDALYSQPSIPGGIPVGFMLDIQYREPAAPSRTINELCSCWQYTFYCFRNNCFTLHRIGACITYISKRISVNTNASALVLVKQFTRRFLVENHNMVIQPVSNIPPWGFN